MSFEQSLEFNKFNKSDKNIKEDPTIKMESELIKKSKIPTENWIKKYAEKYRLEVEEDDIKKLFESGNIEEAKEIIEKRLYQ